MPLIVITRGNIPRSQGGLMIGYQGGNRVFVPGCPPEGFYVWDYLALTAQAAKPKVTSIIYRDLPTANNQYGDCSSCGTMNNSGDRMMTDKGMQTIITCRKCKYRMRPVEK